MCSCPRKNIIWTEDPASTVPSVFKTWNFHQQVEETVDLMKGLPIQGTQVTGLD